MAGLWLAATAIAAAAATAPATGPGVAPPENSKPDEAFLQAQRRQRDLTWSQFANLRQVGPVSFNEAARITLDRGLLHVEVTPLAGPEQVRLQVKGSNATWVVARRPAPAVLAVNAPAAGPSMTLQRFEMIGAERDDDVWAVRLAANDQSLSLSGQSVAGRVTYTQEARNPKPVAISVGEWAAGQRMVTVFSAQAATFHQLRAEHPAEFRKYLLPLLGKLSDLSCIRPDAADVYRVFADIPPDPPVMRQVLALLPDLDARAPRTREAASRRLAATGRLGVLAVLRIDLTPLTEEQRGRLGQFVAGYRRLADLDPADARKDPMFLADALEYPDPAVRAAARAALEAALGRPIEFDVGLSGDALTAAVDGIRKQVAERARPATRPLGKT